MEQSEAMEHSPSRLQQGGTANASSADVSEVRRLILAGKCKLAVEVAKDIHKRVHTPETESLLVDAYAARIVQFQQKGATEDAQVLLKLVHDRFPAHGDRFKRLVIRNAALTANLDEMLAPLAKGDVPEESIRAIEKAIQQDLTDLGALADCGVLPAEHPLRVSAAALRRAFTAVTSGPVKEEQLALPEVSRRSPLAGWKLLIRAMAAFYQRDDATARQALAGIAGDSAAARLAGVLRAMLDGKSAGGGLAGVLKDKVCPDDSGLRRALSDIDSALLSQSPARLYRGIQEAMSACASAHPDLLELLAQRIYAKCSLYNVPIDQLTAVLPTPPGKSYLFGLLAKGSEMRGLRAHAAARWGQFQQFAIMEGRIKEGSIEQAVILQHGAELLAELSLEDEAELMRARRQCAALAHSHSSNSESANERGRILDDLDAGKYFAAAMRILPEAAAFRTWHRWLESHRRPDVDKERMAEQWRRLLPGDPEPCLILSELAEKRKALKKAVGYLEDAEAIDALNPRVRRARLRLIMGILWKHFKEGKAHLVEKDLAELRALPGMDEGVESAMAVLLKGVWHVMRHEQAPAIAAIQAVRERLGVPAANVLAFSALRTARVYDEGQWLSMASPVPPEPRDIAQAMAICIRLSEQFYCRLWYPDNWNAIVEQFLRQDSATASQADLLAIARSSLANDRMQLGYLATGVGLAKAAGPAAARFLLLRARCLPHWAPSRISQCLRAAIELAETSHDEELMNEIRREIEYHPPTRQLHNQRGGQGRKLGAELLAEVMRSERMAKNYPTSLAMAEKHVVAIDPVEPQLFQEYAEKDGDDFDDDNESDDEYNDEHDGEFDIPAGMNLPPRLLHVVHKVLDQFGRMPSVDELMKQQPELAMELVMALAESELGAELFGKRKGPSRRKGGK